MAHRLLVEGPSACFRRPEIGDDEVTYDVMTPVSARRVFEAIHWTPSIWWRVEQIEVLNPIRTEWRDRPGHGRSRRSLCLLDVRYLIDARFEIAPSAERSENAAQHTAMFKRRAKTQRFFRQPELGGNAWPATVRLVGADEQFRSSHIGMPPLDLGWMTFDRDQADREKLRFFRPTMVDGVIDLRGIDPTGLPL